VYSYSDQEYADHINGQYSPSFFRRAFTYAITDPDSGWSKEETDYLFDLVKAYTARFYIILDRYEYPGKLAFSNPHYMSGSVSFL